MKTGFFLDVILYTQFTYFLQLLPFGMLTGYKGMDICYAVPRLFELP